MDQSEFPTKGNLIRIQHTLALAYQGYMLLDQKRNVLIRELSSFEKQLTVKYDQLNEALETALTCLMSANIQIGTKQVEAAASHAALENSIQIQNRSIMGVELPIVKYADCPANRPHYSLADTAVALDEAYIHFTEVKKIIAALAETENTVYRLNASIRKTLKRANALQHIIIPKYESRLKFIQNVLEERERDSFVRLKLKKKTH